MTNKMALSVDSSKKSKSHTRCVSFDNMDPDLLIHYGCKTILKGKNLVAPINTLNFSIQKCLNIAYASGHWMMETATEFPKWEFYGIDSEGQGRSPDLVYPRNCSFHTRSYLSGGLPYPDESFDLIHFQLLLFSLETEQIHFLFDEIKRVLKKSGYVEFLEPVINDYDPSSPSRKLSSMEFYIENLTERGFVNVKGDKVPVPLREFSALKPYIDAHFNAGETGQNFEDSSESVKVLTCFAQKD